MLFDLVWDGVFLFKYWAMIESKQKMSLNVPVTCIRNATQGRLVAKRVFRL